MHIVILSFNHPELTSRTVQSALAHLPATQITLVHNGSLAQHQLNLKNQFPKLNHLIITANKGFSGGANAGLSHVFGQGHEWILFLTNDCQLTQLGSPPSKPCHSAPLIWRRKEGLMDSLGGKLNLKKAQLRHCHSVQDFYHPEDAPYIPGTAFWIHRDIFQTSGGFDESLGTYWEDVDLSLRIRKLGHALEVSPMTRIIHQVGKTCHKDTYYTTYLFQRNRKTVCLKHSDYSWRVHSSLVKSWSQTAGKMALRGDWKKMKILWQAIRD